VQAGCKARAAGRALACGALSLAAAVLMAACTATPTASSDRGVRRCDRNGDLEERLACNP